MPFNRRCLLAAFSLVAAAFAAPAAAVAQSGKLVIYNPAGDVGELFVSRFQEMHPDIRVSMISGGVGAMFTRIGAEAANPRGDVIICASTEAFLANSELFEAHESAEADSFPADVIGPDFL